MARLIRANGIEGELDGERLDRQLRDWKGVSELIGGGYIAFTRSLLSPSICLLCDEEGLLKGLPFNRAATQISGRTLVGDVIVMDRMEARKWGWG